MAVLVALVGLLGAMIQAGWIPPPKDWFGHDQPTSGTTCTQPLCLDPASGPVGALVKVHGAGFQPDENVTLRLAEDEIGTAHTDGAGAFEAQLTIPSSYTGRGRSELTVSALGETSQRLVSAVFVLTAP